MKKNFIQNLSYLNFTIITIFVWWLIYGLNISFQPYIWDDLSFFRIYTFEELLGTWIGNWDPDEISHTKSYRPMAILYYHITYWVFGENLFLFRTFVVLEILLLLILTNQVFEMLNFSKNQILIFTLLLVFSKIFITLVSWFTISVLIMAYIFTLVSIKYYFLSIKKNNTLYFFTSLLFASFAILTREELYVLPAIICLLYFYKFDINLKNIYTCIKSTFLFFTLVFTHIFLRKILVPGADNIQFIDNKIFYGENVIRFGGYIQAVKSSFLPMGYLSSSYSDDIQKFFSIFWILLIFLALIFIIKIYKLEMNKLKKILIMFSLVIISALPHLTIARSFGIFLPSIFALMIVSILIDKTFFRVDFLNDKLKYFGKVLSIVIIFTGVIGGIYRSFLHLESVNKFSNSIVQYDARMLFHKDTRNATIPKKRYDENKKHLENLNVYEYNWEKTYGEILSPKIIDNKYHPLRF